MDKNILCTYKVNGEYTYCWLDEEEVQDWIEENQDKYEYIEIIRIKSTQLLYTKIR